MTLATRADLEALRGATYIDVLLSSATDVGDPLSDAQKTARLQSALQSGDDLIAQFLPLPESPDDPRSAVLRRFAVDEALFTLQRHTSSGANDSDHAAADQRRRDLAHMRKREQFAGTPEQQRTTTPSTVASSSPFALDKLSGLV